MASVVLSGDTSGSITIAAPAVAGSNTQTLVAATGTLAPLISGTAVASTSGTSVDFTSIPSWVKRITVMLQGVSTNATDNLVLQVGSGSVASTGYLSTCGVINSNTAYTASGATANFIICNTSGASDVCSGVVTLCLLSGNSWAQTGTVKANNVRVSFSAGDVTLSGTLDRVRVTSSGGTATFDAGTINIMWE